MSGDVQVRFCERLGVRFPRPTHLVMCFQVEKDARAVRRLLDERLQKFGLLLHPEKTRVIRFGRYAEDRSAREGGREPPQSFDFLGFTHIGARDKERRFIIVRRTTRKKRRAKYQALKEELRRRRHRPEAEQHKWLASVLRGIFQFYAVPGNLENLRSMRYEVKLEWYRQLQRRSQRARWKRKDYQRREKRYPLPWPRLTHRLPVDRYPKTKGGSPVRENRSPGSVRGAR
jgi:RNA-directed DNA polymerase